MSAKEDEHPSSALTRKHPPEKLLPDEVYWKNHYEWLLQAGYRLRSRYSPDWQASWVGTNMEPDFCEDAEVSMSPAINHATSKDNVFVVLKLIDISKYPEEVQITSYLSEEPLRSDPNNHAVPLIEVLDPPEDDNLRILVLPLLRSYDDPPFETVGEAVHFLDHFFKAIGFLHANRVVHGDVSINNVMIDATDMYPKGFHPVAHWRKPDFSGNVYNKFSRTERAPKYYIVDFGLSQRFEPDEVPKALPRIGTDTSVPEYHNDARIDPFFVDVYCVGNMIRQEFLDGDPERASRCGYYGFEWLRPLISDMIQEDGAKRPTMTAVVTRFEEMVKGISSNALRSPCRKIPAYKGQGGTLPVVVAKSIHHWGKRVSYVLRGLPPIPKP